MEKHVVEQQTENSIVAPEQVGKWSVMKHRLLMSYASAYSRIMASETWCRGHYYIDAFAGCGQCVRRDTNEFVDGSPLHALRVDPRFTGYFFVDLNAGKIEHLRSLVADRPGIEIYNDDCNVVLPKQVFPQVQFRQFKRALCFLDPYGLHIDWEVVRTAGQMRSVELFINFSILDFNYNLSRDDPRMIDPDQLRRMDRFWGDRSWFDLIYGPAPTLFEQSSKGRIARACDVLPKAYKKRLEDVAGFAYVAEPIAVRNDSGGDIYYLFFASANETGRKIVTDIFDKYRRTGETGWPTTPV